MHGSTIVFSAIFLYLLLMVYKRFRQNEAEESKGFDKAELLAAVGAHAAILDAVIDNLREPAELEKKPEFQLGVGLLDNPVLENRELLDLSSNPASSLWQMAIKAVGGRARDTDLVEPLLALIRVAGPWHLYFLMPALDAHTPEDRSLVGDVLLQLRNDEGPLLAFELQVVASVLAERIAKEESPSFGDRLESLTGEETGKLETLLTTAMDSPLREAAVTLQAELEAWRATYVDRKSLRTVGRVWDPSADAGPGPIAHRDLEILGGEILDSLQQSPRRSTLVVGEYGVGKTALIGWACRKLMAQGWIVFEASGSDLIAGQRYMGDLEQRLKSLLDMLGKGRQVLWYVPEFQTLGLTGRHQYSQTSILDMMLPLVDSGDVALVGELGAGPYQRLVRKYPRLKSGFTVVNVPPLGEDATLRLAADWSDAHGLVEGQPLVEGPVLQEAWLLACQYLSDREPPGRLLDFLAEVRQDVVKARSDRARLGRDDLLATMSSMTCLPRQILDERLSLDIENLRRFFHQRIMGQPEAVDCLIQRISLIKAGLTDPTRPQGVFLFAGPTGTGKTEIAKALAEFLFGTQGHLLRYDMSEFQSAESLERLTGAGRMMEDMERESLILKIRKQPFSVILLDEFEKAHPKVWDLFLQVFDDGRLTDPRGDTADFRHAIIILTSNLGGRSATGAGLGFVQDGTGFRAAAVDKAVAEAFRPEFLNRLDQVVVFRPFSRATMRKILEKELRDVQERRGLRNRSWAVVWEDAALEFLLDHGFSPTLGARPLKRAVERHLLVPLADTIVRNKFPAGDQFLYIQAQEGGLTATFIDPEVEIGDEVDEAPVESAAVGRPDGERSLPSIALNPTGTPQEFADLHRHQERLRERILSPDWAEAKALALSMMSLPDFWSSPERFAVLGEVEYRERVETGLKTANTLMARIDPEGGVSRGRYPRALVGRLAERLFLLDAACDSLARGLPWEAFVLIQAKPEPMSGSGDVDAVASRLVDMYRGWGEQRKMRVSVLEDVAGDSGQGRRILLQAAGYAAYSILGFEDGLHVWEVPSEGGKKTNLQHKVLVRVEPQPVAPITGGEEAVLATAREAFRTQRPAVPAVTRTYRELPDPLVKDRCRGWRTGRLERVLMGDFDLFGASTEDEAARQEG